MVSANTSFPTTVPKVLIVEDDGTETILVRVACRALPWSVRIVDSSAAALSAVETPSEALDGNNWSRPDLIIVDLHLGPDCGLELVQQFIARPALKGVPIISWSGLSHPSLPDLVAQAGAVEFAQKPFHLQKVITLFRDFDARWLRRTTSPKTDLV